MAPPRRTLLLGLAGVVQSSATACPESFTAFGDQGCFHVSDESATFTECQQRVCAGMNSTLATIGTEESNAFIKDLLGNLFIGYIGLFEYGADESGDWRWVDGSPSGMRLWSDGEPNNWCIDEDCAIIMPGSDRWLDASCGLQARCICQFGGTASSEYMEMEGSMTMVRSEGAAKYKACKSSENLSEQRGGRCWWMNSTLTKALFLLLGLPCVGIVAFALCRTCGVATGIWTEFEVLPGSKDPRLELSAVDDGSYGFLIDKADAEGDVDVDRVVQVWIARGACGAMLYAIVLVALASTMFAHVNGVGFSFWLDALEALLMCACKVAVAFSAYTVHEHLSPYARLVAGPWVLVLAASKAMMALCALCLSIIYFSVSVSGEKGTTFCGIGYLFILSLLLSSIFQCIAGFAFFRLHERAASHVGDMRVFSRVLQCWWGALVGGTFGTGIAMWFCGMMFVFDSPLDEIDPFDSIPFAYFFAACCQLLAGVSMVVANSRVQEYFANHPGRSAVELTVARHNGASEAAVEEVTQLMSRE